MTKKQLEAENEKLKARIEALARDGHWRVAMVAQIRALKAKIAELEKTSD